MAEGFTSPELFADLDEDALGHCGVTKMAHVKTLLKAARIITLKSAKNPGQSQIELVQNEGSAFPALTLPRLDQTNDEPVANFQLRFVTRKIVISF